MPQEITHKPGILPGGSHLEEMGDLLSGSANRKPPEPVPLLPNVKVTVELEIDGVA
jgi:hypothetical protein